MQKILTSHKFSHVTKALRYMTLRLSRVPELSSYIPEVNDLRIKLQNEWDTWQEAVENRIALTGEIEYLDKDVDRDVVTIGQTAWLHYDRKRTNPNFKKLFPVSPSVMVKEVAGQNQMRWVKTLIETIYTDDEYAFLRDLTPNLTTNMEKLQGAINQREELYRQEALARVNYTIVLDNVRNTYNSLYHQFLLAMPDEKSLVESLFYSKNPAINTEDPTEDN
ncbi:hypothetical protein KKF34_18965 [Myxococcota bacterium]|nr:hypothetical protein [Myxococcota bacterium]MBU1498969.1 hypothetical protein [Myxococcota bacterium]